MDLVMSSVMHGKVAVLANDRIGPFFESRKGLRQGDPLSPILFNTAVDVLNTLIVNAVDCGLLEGLAENLVEGGVSMLQYADDTIFMFQDSLESARNLKSILCIFEQLSGLKINFHKSELYCFGRAKEKVQDYSAIFTCAVGSVPFKYLGVPVHHSRLSKENWGGVEEKVEKKLHTWAGKQNSYGGA